MPSTGPGVRHDGRARADRAAQFMPFAALSGYYELAERQEWRPEARHELTEEEAEGLSRILVQVKRGDLIRVTYYDGGRYHTRVGRVTGVQPAFRRLCLEDRRIAFDDIRSVERHPC